MGNNQYQTNQNTIGEYSPILEQDDYMSKDDDLNINNF